MSFHTVSVQISELLAHANDLTVNFSIAYLNSRDVKLDSEKKKERNGFP